MTTDILIATLSFVQVTLVVIAVWLTRRHFNILRASSYIERFNSESSILSRIAVDKWLSEDADERLGLLDDDKVLNARVRVFANLFQELATAYFHNTVDRGVVLDCFDFLVPHYWRHLESWVKHVRGADNPTLYRKFERLASEMSRASSV